MSRYFELRREKGNQLFGKEIFEIKPVILGGDSSDMSNKVFLNREQHIKAVRYWNRFVNEMKC